MLGSGLPCSTTLEEPGSGQSPSAPEMPLLDLSHLSPWYKTMDMCVGASTEDHKTGSGTFMLA
jgi:hypothetical protein